MYDALSDLNGAITSLLRLNWKKYPWAKEVHNNLSRLYDILLENVKTQKQNDKSQIFDQKDDEA